jgi:hypothetical protein
VSDVFLRQKGLYFFNHPSVGIQQVDHSLLPVVPKGLLVNFFLNAHRCKGSNEQSAICNWQSAKRKLEQSCRPSLPVVYCLLSIENLPPHLYSLGAIGADVNVLAALEQLILNAPVTEVLQNNC